MTDEDKKITQLTTGVPASTDLIPYVSDPDGTPVTKVALVSDIGGGSGGGGEGILVNGVISVSVTSNNLTVAIKTLAGADPSAGDSVDIQIDGVIRSITSALSVTKNAATNWCNAGGAELATKLVQYFVYLGYNSTDGVVLGFSRIPYARFYSDFSATSTNEKYAGISTITHAASTDSYKNIGRFSATLSAGAGYTWSISGTGNVVNRPIYETDTLSWLPVWTNLSVGNGTYSATYKIMGTRIHFDIDIIFGNTTSISGDVSHSTPIAGINYGNAKVAGTLALKDTGAAQYSGVNLMQSASLINYRVLNASGTYATQVAISSTIPFTWTTTDELHEWATHDLV